MQAPILNHFKHFLKSNPHHLTLSGIVYPQKIPSAIEGIPVLDFEEILNESTSPIIFIECFLPSNQKLSSDFQKFFQENDIKSMKISDLLNSLISNDSENTLNIPFHGISTADLRALHNATPPSFIGGKFLDPESFTIAKTLHSIFCQSRWEELMGFDKDKSLHQTLLDSLSLIQKTRAPHNYQIIDSPQLFLGTLLKLRHLNEDQPFTVTLTSTLAAQLGESLEFHEKCFNKSLIITDDATENPDTTAYLSGCASFMHQRLGDNLPTPTALMIMRRSILDYHSLASAFEEQEFRISLRQVDTQPEHLIAAFFS